MVKSPTVEGGRLLLTLVVGEATVGAAVARGVEVGAAGVVERLVGVDVEMAVAVAAVVLVEVGAFVAVAVGGTAVAVGSTGVAVAVADTGVAVGGTGVAVGGTGVGVIAAPRTVVETELEKPEKIPTEAEA